MPKVPQSLYLIHFMLMLSPALFAVAMYFTVQPGETQNSVSPQETIVFQTVTAVLAVIAVGMSQLIPRLLMREEKQVPVRRYSSMKIVQWALIEGAAIFIGIVFFLTHQKNLLIPLGVLIALLALMRPTVDEMQRHNVKD